MDFMQIKELIALIDATELTELEIEQDGFKIRIRKNPSMLLPRQGTVADEIVSSELKGQFQVKSESGFMEISAPMVGTFHRAPAPDVAPYIQIGDRIEEGEVLFIIEAMKMMNEIVAESSGVVKEFLAKNGQPVEYGQPLILIDPRG